MSVDLGGIRLSSLTEVAVRERARVVRHPVPGMDGDLSQTLGRPSVEVRLRGICYGPEAAADLEALRALHLARQPVEFSARGTGEGYVAEVLITAIESAERAGELDQFAFECTLMEYVEPPQPAAADPFGALEADLLGDALSFVDGVQDALADATALIDAIGGFPSFGDPTSLLEGLLTDFADAAGEGAEAIRTIQELF